MKCPFCNENYNEVTNSRETKQNTQIWRRRKCLKCKAIFTTYEALNLSFISVEKKSGQIERFNHSKLFAGIFLASVSKKNSDKGQSAEFAEKIAQRVLYKILEKKIKKIKTSEIREIVLKELLETDPQTYMHFLSYVMKFPNKESIIKIFNN